MAFKGIELVQTCWGIEYAQPVLPATHMVCFL
jgi:hypothetical protein